ncbi:AraC family transcriptional regulator [Exilibacterium tricleocarpae]|uniref:AraC family transcriptional regulator n=1 Tax=Exilibacterium tricleocarpae TaxID=2591008 RepID=A0A545TFC7_9GAMM|nr:AraC family transcriptional regulator [Exilibacterium tricleocarpae]TQV75929.1 AraC family transcriptional regulator [Exilibacterium tricleocarpae]
MRYPLINNSFLDGFSQLVLEKGGKPAELFEAARLPAEVVTGPDTLIPFDRHTQLLDLAARRLRCPQFSLELASRQTIAIYGPLAAMVTRCQTLGEAMGVFIKHLQLQVQTVDVEMRRAGDLVQIFLHCDFELVAKSVGYQDHALALSHNLSQMLSGTAMPLRAVYFQHGESADHGLYSRYFNCPVAFNQPFLGLAYDARLLRQPIAASARRLPDKLRSYLAHRHGDSFVDQVKHVIAMLLIGDGGRLEAVAQVMGYSARTLQRRLGEHNTSFQALIDSVRYAQATSYLGHPYYRLTDIAAILGYSELSAFTRSFKRWFGISPQQWRKHQRQLHANSNPTTQPTVRASALDAPKHLTLNKF